MHLNSEFYAKHPSFGKAMNRHSDVFKNVDTSLALSVSHSALNSGKTKMKLVKKKHSIFVVHLNGQVFCVCLLYLQFACVLLIAILSYDAMLKNKIMFNQLIKPREFPSLNSETIHLLFCNNCIVPPITFRHNHYVPLIFCSEKNEVNKT